MNLVCILLSQRRRPCCIQVLLPASTFGRHSVGKSWPTITHAFISLIYNHIPQRYPQRGCYSVIIKPLHIHTHIWCSIPGHKSINAPPLFIHWEIWRNPFIIALYTSKDYVHWDQHCTQFITGSFNEATHTHTHTAIIQPTITQTWEPRARVLMDISTANCSPSLKTIQQSCKKKASQKTVQHFLRLSAIQNIPRPHNI